MTLNNFVSRKSYFLNNANSFIRKAAENLELTISENNDKETLDHYLGCLELAHYDKSESHLFFVFLKW